MVTRAWRISAFAVDINLFITQLFALLAMFFWAMELVIEPRLSSPLRAVTTPW